MKAQTLKLRYLILVVGVTVVAVLATSHSILQMRAAAQLSCGSSRLVANRWISAELPSRGTPCVYTFVGRAGTVVSIAMVRDGYSRIDPWLDLTDPGGYLVASDNNSFRRGGLDSLISRYTLRRTGTYRIIARDRTNRQTGGFQIYLQY